MLNNPDGPTRDDLDFAAQGLKLPVTGVRTLPHLPNYNLFDLTGSPCDTLGIGMATQSPGDTGCELRMIPNPASTSVRIDVAGCRALNGVLFDLAGRRLKHIDLPIEGGMELNVSDLAPGVYYVQVQEHSGQTATKLLAVLR